MKMTRWLLILFFLGAKERQMLMNPSDDFMGNADGAYGKTLKRSPLERSQKKASTATVESQHFVDTKFVKKAMVLKNSNPNAAQRSRMDWPNQFLLNTERW